MGKVYPDVYRRLLQRLQAKTTTTNIYGSTLKNSFKKKGL